MKRSDSSSTVASHAFGVIALLASGAMGLAACLIGLAAGSAHAQSTVRVIESEPGARRIVIEDDATRIEETRVRGETQRVVVKSKRTALPEWEIRPDSPGRTAAGETRLPRDTAHARVWRVWTF